MKQTISFLFVLLFSLNSFSQGHFIEYNISSGEKGTEPMGNMKAYFQQGNSRVDMNMKNPMLADGAMNIIAVILSSSPDSIYMLFPKNRTYSVFAASNSKDYKDYPEKDYEVEVIGKEKANGYNTVHVKVNVKEEKLEQELWTSTDVKDYASLSKLKTKYTGKDNLYKALEANGASGFPVKIMASEKGGTVVLDLVKAESRNNPDELFSLNGYKEGDALSGLLGGIDLKQMLKDLQNMTPEKREEMMRQMKKMYSPEK